MAHYDNFVDAASRYCRLIERHVDIATEEFLNQTHEILPLLYYRAVLLRPEAATETPIDFRIPHDTWKSIYDGIGALLENKNIYWSLFDPIAENPQQPVAKTIADDLADIWCDLAIGVKLWPTASDVERRCIIWEWRFSFQVHWSRHLVDALCALNRILVFNRFPESEHA